VLSIHRGQIVQDSEGHLSSLLFLMRGRQIPPAAQPFGSLPQGLAASTPFIGIPRHNFSHGT
jgi:hypothetical protein